MDSKGLQAMESRQNRLAWMGNARGSEEAKGDRQYKASLVLGGNSQQRFDPLHQIGTMAKEGLLLGRSVLAQRACAR